MSDTRIPEVREAEIVLFQQGIHIWKGLYLCVCVCVFVCVCIYAYNNIYICIIYTYIYVCMYACMHVHMYVYIYRVLFQQGIHIWRRFYLVCVRERERVCVYAPACAHVCKSFFVCQLFIYLLVYLLI